MSTILSAAPRTPLRRPMPPRLIALAIALGIVIAQAEALLVEDRHAAGVAFQQAGSMPLNGVAGGAGGERKCTLARRAQPPMIAEDDQHLPAADDADRREACQG